MQIHTFPNSLFTEAYSFYNLPMKSLEHELQLEYIRAGGPGGQNVNKVATAVQLRFDVTNSPSLTADVKTRLIKLAGKRMTDAGVLIIEASKFRTQEKIARMPLGG